MCHFPRLIYEVNQCQAPSTVSTTRDFRSVTQCSIWGPANVARSLDEAKPRKFRCGSSKFPLVHVHDQARLHHEEGCMVFQRDARVHEFEVVVSKEEWQDLVNLEQSQILAQA